MRTYKLELTPVEVSALTFIRGRYQWPEVLIASLVGNTIELNESELWNWVADVETDMENGHSPFPLASHEFAEKLWHFYCEVE